MTGGQEALAWAKANPRARSPRNLRRRLICNFTLAGGFQGSGAPRSRAGSLYEDFKRES